MSLTHLEKRKPVNIIRLLFDPEYGLSNTDKSLPVVEKGSLTYEYRGEKYTYLAPKKEPDVPHELLQVVLGISFAGGRSRVCEIFHTGRCRHKSQAD